MDSEVAKDVTLCLDVEVFTSDVVVVFSRKVDDVLVVPSSVLTVDNVYLGVEVLVVVSVVELRPDEPSDVSAVETSVPAVL